MSYNQSRYWRQQVPPLITSAQETVDDGEGDPAGPTLLVAENLRRQTVMIFNVAGGADIYFGPADVEDTTGILLPAGAAVSVDTTAAIYAITESGTATVNVLETHW